MNNPNEIGNNDQEEPSSEAGKPPAMPKVVISPETLKGFAELSASILPYLEQNRLIIAKVAEDAALQQSIIAKLNLNLVAPVDVSRLIGEQTKYLEIHKAFQSPVLELVENVNTSIGRLFAATVAPPIAESLKQMAFPSDAWSERFSVLNETAKAFARSDLALQSHLADIAEYSVLSQASIARLHWAEIGNALDVQAHLRTKLQATFLDFTQTYAGLFDSFQKTPLLIATLPPIVSRLSAVEYFAGVEVVDAITIDPIKDVEFQTDKQQALAEVEGETGERLEILLSGMNRELIAPLCGARQSLSSSNPDRVRHFATSLRELFTHVVHSLAPDVGVKSWTDDPDCYGDEGKPTRRARLLYICRDVNHDPFSRFIEKDIDALLEFLKLFQRGTHEVIPKYDETQLRVMLVRMEAALRFLLEISDKS